jgi:hypothetical protein
MIDSEKLAVLAKALDSRSKDLVKKEKDRALEAEEDLNAAIDLLELGKVDYEDLEEYQKQSDDSLATDNKTIVGAITEIDGKIKDINETINNQVIEISASLEYLNNTKLDTSVATTHFIQSVLSKEEESYDLHILFKDETVEKIISPLVSIDTVIDNDGATLTTYLSYFDTAINNLTSSIGNGDELLTDAKDNVVSCINELQTEINNLNNELKVIDAITLNGYSLWVGSSTELNALPERDEKTLYFEIDDDEIEEVVQVDIIDNKLNLTADKYQKANVINGTEIIFPDVNKFTEIHLYFDANENMNLIFPDNCKYRVDPNIEEGNSYEIVATYNTMKWLVNIIVYS